MIGKLVLAALIAGMMAGAVLAGIQHVKLSPLILAAEVYEKAADAAAETKTANTTALPGAKCVESMPGMTMNFSVKDKSWLEQYKTGDKVKFRAEKMNGGLIVTTIEHAM